MTKTLRQRTRLVVCTAIVTAAAAATPSPRLRGEGWGEGQPAIHVTAAGAVLVERGVAAAAPADPTTAGFETVPAPGIKFVANTAQSTTAPWIDSNAWRFKRGLRKANYATIPAGSAPLAAAEAFTFGADAILNPKAADVDELCRMLEFLKGVPARPLPDLANIAVVDGPSPLLGEVLNLLARRNLLYTVVKKPEPKLLTVQLGSAAFPEQAAANPSDFAAMVRAKLGDDKRLVRLYGTSTLMAQLKGDDKAARLYLLSYGGARRQGGSAGAQPQGVRVRVLGRYKATTLRAYGAAADASLADVDTLPDATEFTLPAFRTIAIVDLERIK
jgi:hypothetical protein